MSQSIGPVLATGALASVNRTVFNHETMDWRILPATALAATGFSLIERVWPKGAVIMAWTTFLTVLLTRIDNQKSPVENALTWWNSGGN
jgi:hypothetical protein